MKTGIQIIIFLVILFLNFGDSIVLAKNEKTEPPKTQTNQPTKKTASGLTLAKKISPASGDELQPILDLIDEGYYRKAKDELDIVLITNQDKESWKKMIDKLELIVKITPELPSQSMEAAEVRDGLMSFLKPKGNPKEALAKINSALIKSNNVKSKETVQKLYDMLEIYYPQIAIPDRTLEEIKPVLNLIEKGCYLDAQNELDILLLSINKNPDWDKLMNKLLKITEITPRIIGQTRSEDIARKGLSVFLQPVDNPKAALIKLRYSCDISEGKYSKEITRKLYLVLQKYYPQTAKTENIPDETTLVNFKLAKALNHIYASNFNSAIQESKEILELEPKNVTALKRLGSAYYCQSLSEKNKELNKKAQEIWKRVLELDPKDEEVKGFLANK